MANVTLQIMDQAALGDMTLADWTRLFGAVSDREPYGSSFWEGMFRMAVTQRGRAGTPALFTAPDSFSKRNASLPSSPSNVPGNKVFPAMVWPREGGGGVMFELRCLNILVRNTRSWYVHGSWLMFPAISQPPQIDRPVHNNLRNYDANLMHNANNLGFFHANIRSQRSNDQERNRPTEELLDGITITYFSPGQSSTLTSTSMGSSTSSSSIAIVANAAGQDNATANNQIEHTTHAASQDDRVTEELEIVDSITSNSSIPLVADTAGQNNDATTSQNEDTAHTTSPDEDVSDEWEIVNRNLELSFAIDAEIHFNV